VELFQSLLLVTLDISYLPTMFVLNVLPHPLLLAKLNVKLLDFIQLVTHVLLVPLHLLPLVHQLA
jgi:hypothetical protein